jgi:glycogen debranching enzyme
MMSSTTSASTSNSNIDADKEFIGGIPFQLVDCASMIQIDQDDPTLGGTVVRIDPDAPPGTVFLFDTWLASNDTLSKLHELESLDGTIKSGIAELCQDLTLQDIGLLLYQANAEERERTSGDGVYNIPGYGDLAYCGLEGIATVLRVIMKNNDLGHPLCSNIREGPWLMDYTVGRLERAVRDGHGTSPLSSVATWLKDRFDLVKTVPNYLMPKYFASVVMSVVVAAREAAFSKMSHFVKRSPTFVRQLALTSVQLTNTLKSASLYPAKSVPAMAAGLPHFATNHMVRSPCHTPPPRHTHACAFVALP